MSENLTTVIIISIIIIILILISSFIFINRDMFLKKTNLIIVNDAAVFDKIEIPESFNNSANATNDNEIKDIQNPIPRLKFKFK